MWNRSAISAFGLNPRKAGFICLVVLAGCLLGGIVWFRSGRKIAANKVEVPGDVAGQRWSIEVVEVWDQLGLSGPYGIDVCDDGDVLVADTGNDRLLRLDGSGAVLGSLNAIPSPIRVSCGGDGEVLVVSRGGRLFKVQMDGITPANPLWVSGSENELSALSMGVTDIDFYRFRVGSSVESVYLVAFLGSEDRPPNIAFVPKEGSTRVFPLPLRNGRQGLLGVVEPVSIAADPRGSGELAYCTSIGELQPVQWLAPKAWGFAPRIAVTHEGHDWNGLELTGSARDLAFDSLGNLIVLDGVNGRLVAFDNLGREIGVFGGQNVGQTLVLKEPMGFAVVGDAFFIVDTGNDRIIVLESQPRAAGSGR